MRKIVIVFCACLFLTFMSFSQILPNTTERDSIYSDILEVRETISVYLPPSYFTSDQKFPVLYILDGDYNFSYVAGILELQGSVSEDIPEMILVAISGKGTETYRNNCRPNIEGIADKGNADKYADFIEKELVPFVSKTYKVADYKILSGHSIGGLFVTNTALDRPSLFDAYIAISPALYWGNKAMHEKVKRVLDKNSSFKTNVYMSIADEKGMEIDSFLAKATKSILKNKIGIYGIGILAILLSIFLYIKRRKVGLPIRLTLIGIVISAYLFFFYYPSDSNFKFKEFRAENHNSVGATSYDWALREIFSTWQGKAEYFNTAAELKAYRNEVVEEYGTAFNFRNALIGYTIYILQDNREELQAIQSELKTSYPSFVADYTDTWAKRLVKKEMADDAEKLLEEFVQNDSSHSGIYNTLAKIKLEKDEVLVADSLIRLSIRIADKQKLRQWQMNELVETQSKVNAKKQ